MIWKDIDFSLKVLMFKKYQLLYSSKSNNIWNQNVCVDYLGFTLIREGRGYRLWPVLKHCPTSGRQYKLLCTSGILNQVWPGQISSSAAAN